VPESAVVNFDQFVRAADVTVASSIPPTWKGMAPPSVVLFLFSLSGWVPDEGAVLASFPLVATLARAPLGVFATPVTGRVLVSRAELLTAFRALDLLKIYPLDQIRRDRKSALRAFLIQRRLNFFQVDFS
jgi:hypothetical protein